MICLVKSVRPDGRPVRQFLDTREFIFGTLDMPSEPHEPVMVSELLAIFGLAPGARVADLTVGAGGHATELLARLGPAAALIGLDRDGSALELAKVKIGKDPRVKLGRARFSEFANAVEAHFGADAPKFDAILMDLGVSSMQLDSGDRGFSFQREGPLDLRMNPGEGGLTAADLVNTASEKEIADLIFEFGEERASRKIARRIIEERARVKITTTTQLAEIVRRCVPFSKADSGRIHPATRTFQALRMVVNNEAPELETGLTMALARLAPEGILAVLSYHSIEDRIVKYKFREAAATEEFVILTKKPARPGDEETRRNPRSRSAKLRAIVKRANTRSKRFTKGGE